MPKQSESENSVLHYETELRSPPNTMYLRAGALAVLVSATIIQSFHYSKTTDVFRRAEDCQMCYKEHCFNLESARCEYYLLADEMLQGNENLGSLGAKIKVDEEDEDLTMRTDVNEALFDLVEKASEVTDQECIPYISRYTDCTKENICLGCTSCDCNAEGSWECNDVQTCRLEKPINVNHRVLIMVMENIMNRNDRPEGKLTKTKRSVTEDPLKASTNKVTFEELAEWWYGVKPLGHEPDIYNKGLTTANIENTTLEHAVKIENGKTTESGSQDSESTTATLIITDADSLAFEEVLSNIGFDTQNYVRRKLPMDLALNDSVYDVEYMILDENNQPMNNEKPDFIPNILSVVNDIKDGIEEPQNEASQVVIDLLESAKNNNMHVKNVTDYVKIYKDNVGANLSFENTNDIIEYDAVNIMKRDVSRVENVTETVNVTPQTNLTNSTEHRCHTNDTILTSLSDLITDMHKELKELQSVKGNLINFVKSYTGNKSAENNKIVNNVVNSKYVTEYTHTNGSDLRRNNLNMREKYMNRLKHDIQQVLRDIVGLQKFRNVTEFRDDLKVLIRAMKRYISQTGVQDYKENQIKLDKFRNLRRYWSVYRHSTSPKENVIKILNIIDKHIPKVMIMDGLSATARKIVNRVIKQYYIDDFSAIGLKAHDSSHNLTNDLQSVGIKWHELASDIENSSPFEKPYTMKLLHLAVTRDINKMNDALALVNFSHNRRVIPIFRNMEFNIVDKISTSLRDIDDKITLLFHIHNRISKMPPIHSSKNVIAPLTIVKDNIDNKRGKQKKSFLKRIKNLLRGSKKDVVELLNKRVPNADIVKEIARKKMNVIAQKKYNEYEETMKRWQKNLNVQPRKKRSMLDTNGFRARMKNIIIPKYLRGKVDGKVVVQKRSNVNMAHADKSAKRKRINKAGNKTIQKPVSLTPKLTTPRRLSDY